MPEAVSPLTLALRRFWRIPSGRRACWVLLLFVLVAVYAPFLASESAYFWWDERGLSFPLLRDLFNFHSFRERHDLLFNIVAVLLPFLLIAGRLLRRYWSIRRRLLSSVLLIVVVWLMAQLPLFAPLEQGGDRRAFWDRRPVDKHTVIGLRHRAALAEDLFVAERGDVLVEKSDGQFVEVIRSDREQQRLLVRSVGSQESGWWLAAEKLRVLKHYAALLPPVPHDYDQPYANGSLKHPFSVNEITGARYWLGSDQVGRDVLARMFFGARISLTIGLVATSIAMLIGIIIGAASGYFGGWVDLILQRIVEIMMCFPSFMLMLFVVAVVGKSIFIIMVVQGLVGWAGTARLVRGEFLGQASREYVLAAQAMGLRGRRIMFRHILPNALTPLLIAASFSIAGAVLSETGLAFLNLMEARTPSWGLILNAGRDKIEYPHLIYAPVIAIFVLVYSLNMIGNGLREAIDAKGQS